MVEHVCPECKVERTDYEGIDRHLATCPNCGSRQPPTLSTERHDVDCACDDCVAWFTLRRPPGKCSWCYKPIDEHTLDASGRMQGCVR